MYSLIYAVIILWLTSGNKKGGPEGPPINRIVLALGLAAR
jgi:hypothetical protein